MDACDRGSVPQGNVLLRELQFLTPLNALRGNCSALITSNHGVNALASVLLRPHIFFSFPKNFIIILLRVYNETIHRPAPSWLVSLIGRALHRYRSARVQIPYKPEFFSSFLFATTKVAFFTAMIILHLILHFGVHIYDFRKFKTLYFLCLFLSKKINSLFYKLP